MGYSDLESLKNDEKKYVMQTYKRNDVFFIKGKNATLWDIDDKEYIDLASGIGVCSLGYSNDKIINVINEQSKKLLHVSNLFYTEPMVCVAKKLCENTHFNKVFLCNSGAEANEGAIKLARKYSTDKYSLNRNKIITLKNSFHGRTVTTLSATGQDKFHKYFYPFTNGFSFVNANNYDELKNMIDENTCAVMVELIQGEGGVVPMDKTYIKKVENICKNNDILLIVDEIQTGIGRTGELFCYTNYDIKPNIVSVAKGISGGMPMGAILADKSCCDVLSFGEHGTTFGGNPVACMCANVVLDEVMKNDFLGEVKVKGEYIKNKILSFNSPKIHEVRGMGLMIGIVVDEEKQRKYAKKLIDKGVIVITAGKTVVRLLPPLTITYEEINKALEIMKGVFC